ncbi:unnamed protein product [Amoebophrya sp. A25]|nr:unnamed protein product [Amoebophrya sp. A25]|eukprot:GSA25T00001411001.1
MTTTEDMTCNATTRGDSTSPAKGRKETVMPQSEKIVYPIDSVAFLGAGMNIGQPLKGLEVAPEAVRSSNLQGLVRKLGYGWYDHGDLDFDRYFRQKKLVKKGSEPTAKGMTKKNFDKWRSQASTRLSFGAWLAKEAEISSTAPSEDEQEKAEGSEAEGQVGRGVVNQDEATTALLQRAVSKEGKSSEPSAECAKYYLDYPVDNLHLVGPACQFVHDRVLQIQKERPGQFMLTVGGDHSVACPTICAMQKVYPDLCVIWIDAHGDCNTPKSSPSGHYHGMPAAHVMGWFEHHPPGFETWMSKESTQPIVSPNNFCFIGLRDIDPSEAKLMRNSDLHFFTMRDVDERGIANVVKQALERIDPNKRRPIHLSFDIDGCDPSIAPGTGTCARGGLSYREAHYICEELALTRRLVSMDLVEINPVIDTVAEPGIHGDDPDMGQVSGTVRLGTELVLSALGLSTMHRC